MMYMIYFEIILVMKILVKETKNENSNNQDFDTNTLITKLKSNWAKWWLTMALRWAKLNLNWNTLAIWVHTKIHKWQVENVDNMSLIIKSMADMGIQDPNIKIN